jgi:DNA-binding transcriptional regulator YiaG
VIDKGTMREIDASCLTTVEGLSPKAIRAIRARGRL